MLSRTADNLYWIARYMERAETMARLLEVGARIALIPQAGGYRSEWDSLLQASGTAAGATSRCTAPWSGSPCLPGPVRCCRWPTRSRPSSTPRSA